MGFNPIFRTFCDVICYSRWPLYQSLKSTGMRRLRLSATITAVLGFFAVLSLIFLFLALTDIADGAAKSTAEWYVAGACLIVLTTFTLSVFVTLGYLLKTSDRLINLTTDTGITK